MYATREDFATVSFDRRREMDGEEEQSTRPVAATVARSPGIRRSVVSGSGSQLD
jgi:hypothetical protein